MVGHEGEKMSKSLGNLVFVHRLVRGGVDPMAIRLVLMAHHYRSDWEWSEAELEEAGRRLDAYRSAARRRDLRPDVVEALRAALREDLDTPTALTVLDAWAEGRELPAVPGTAAPTAEDAPGDVAAAVDALFGITLRA